MGFRIMKTCTSPWPQQRVCPTSRKISSKATRWAIQPIRFIWMATTIWGKTEKSARWEIFYYDDTDLMALRVDGWKMHIGVKMHNNWFDPKVYPSVPYIVNLLMDPMEKMTPDSEEFGYI